MSEVSRGDRDLAADILSLVSLDNWEWRARDYVHEVVAAKIAAYRSRCRLGEAEKQAEERRLRRWEAREFVRQQKVRLRGGPGDPPAVQISFPDGAICEDGDTIEVTYAVQDGKMQVLQGKVVKGGDEP